MNYRKEIDGLRALAVLPVMLFHAGFQPFNGGFVGVDIFFVISGYLITSIILAEKQAGTFTLVGFYERRARRILPALFVVMFVCSVMSWLWLLPSDMKKFSQSLVAVPAFASNILFYLTSNYFEPAAELTPCCIPGVCPLKNNITCSIRSFCSSLGGSARDGSSRP